MTAIEMMTPEEDDYLRLSIPFTEECTAQREAFTVRKYFIFIHEKLYCVRVHQGDETWIVIFQNSFNV